MTADLRGISRWLLAAGLLIVALAPEAGGTAL
jgi:hypothetical protein